MQGLHRKVAGGYPYGVTKLLKRVRRKQAKAARQKLVQQSAAVELANE